MSLTSKRLFLLLGVALWLAVASWGMKGFVDYSFTPGDVGVPAGRWPTGTALPLTPNGFTFVVALHPECSCSRATAAQLERIMIESRAKLSIVAVFDGRTAEVSPEDSALFAQLRSRPGVTLVNDQDGSEIGRFQFRTSGETRLYRADGVLAFSGGITASRGHEGDNPSQTAVLAALRGDTLGKPQTRAPVFGCSLRCE